LESIISIDITKNKFHIIIIIKKIKICSILSDDKTWEGICKSCDFIIFGYSTKKFRTQIVIQSFCDYSLSRLNLIYFIPVFVCFAICISYLTHIQRDLR